MRDIKSWVGVSLVFTMASQAVWAGNDPVPNLPCPLPHPDYTAVLAKLATIKNEILEPAQCKSVTDRLVDVEKLYNSDERQIVEKLGAGHTTVQELTPEDVQALSQYGQNIAEKVSGLVQALSQNRHCVKDEARPSVLLQIASITQEVTGVAAAHTGPYGIPISLGGGLVAGILRGIDLIFGQKKAYDFDKEEHRQLYVRTVCAYHEVKKEIDGILDPEERTRVVTSLEEHLKVKKAKLEEIKPAETALYMRCHDARGSVLKLGADLVKEVNAIVPLDPVKNPPTKTGVEACLALVALTHHDGSLLHRMHQQVARDATAPAGEAVACLSSDNELGAFLDVLRNQPLEAGGLPKAVDCLRNARPRPVVPGADPNASVTAPIAALNAATADILRGAISIIPTTYQPLLGSLIRNTPEVDLEGGGKINALQWYEGTMTRIRWGEAQLAHLKELSRPGSGAARADIVALNDYLHDGIVHELAPDFITQYRRQASSTLRRFGREARDTERDVRRKVKDAIDLLPADVRNRIKDQIDTLPGLLRALTREPALRGFDHAWVYARVSDLVPTVNLVKFSLQTVSEYCEYFSKNGTRGDEIARACDNDRIPEAQQELTDLRPTLEAFMAYFEWCHDQKIIADDSIRATIQRIRECHAKLPHGPH